MINYGQTFTVLTKIDIFSNGRPQIDIFFGRMGTQSSGWKDYKVCCMLVEPVIIPEIPDTGHYLATMGQKTGYF